MRLVDHKQRDMKIDLSKAVIGDEFELRNGNVAIFEDKQGNFEYPYRFIIDNLTYFYREDGTYMNEADHVLDIVKALTKHEPISIEQKVCDKILERAKMGKNKYGTTMERTDLSIEDWITHAQEEALDLSIYLEKIKSEIALIRK